MLNVSVLHFYCWIIFHVLIQHILFIHLSDDGHLDYFHFLIIMKNATMNICVKVFVWGCVLIFLKKIPKREIGSYFNSIFNIFRNCQTFSKVAGPFYISTSDELRVSVSQHPHHLLLSVFFIIAALMSVKWCHMIWLAFP